MAGAPDWRHAPDNAVKEVPMWKTVRAILLAIMLVSLGATTVLGFGPHPLPDAACNAELVGYGASGGYNVVPHWKDWDGDGEFACYHLNPLYPPGNDSLE
jgi:hypothetical protein